MLTYSEARAILDKARNHEKKLENNTYLHYAENFSANDKLGAGAICVRLHSTDVVSIHADGTYTLNSGGWRTVTTKARINEYCPVGISQVKGVWYLWCDGKRLKTEFFDGIRVDTRGKVLNPVTA